MNTASPTAPRPKTATVEPSSMSAVFQAAPIPDPCNVTNHQ